MKKKTYTHTYSGCIRLNCSTLGPHMASGIAIYGYIPHRRYITITCLVVPASTLHSINVIAYFSLGLAYYEIGI